MFYNHSSHVFVKLELKMFKELALDGCGVDASSRVAAFRVRIPARFWLFQLRIFVNLFSPGIGLSIKNGQYSSSFFPFQSPSLKLIICNVAMNKERKMKLIKLYKIGKHLPKTILLSGYKIIFIFQYVHHIIHQFRNKIIHLGLY